MKRARRRCRQEWCDLTERWRHSELTGVEFARREGLNPSTFAWWRSELTREQKKPPLTLIRVPTPKAPAAHAPVEVVLPAGLVIRVPNSADLGRSADLIARLLEV